MIDLAILGLLAERDLHGYELSKRLTELLGAGASTSFGSIYPALRRLRRQGHVNEVAAGDRPSPVPMTGSLDGELAASRSAAEAPGSRRAKKVYGLTASGSDRLVQLLLDPAGCATASGFALRLALFRHLDSPGRQAVIDARLAALDHLHQQLCRTPQPGDRWQRLRRERELATVADERAWLTELSAISSSVSDTSGVAPPALGAPPLGNAPTTASAVRGGIDTGPGRRRGFGIAPPTVPGPTAPSGGNR